LTSRTHQNPPAAHTMTAPPHRSAAPPPPGPPPTTRYQHPRSIQPRARVARYARLSTHVSLRTAALLPRAAHAPQG
jgi:hypothetical protein